jgi:phage terminase large subunit
MKLNQKQTIAIDYLEDNKTNEGVFGGGAGGGKSVLGTYWLTKKALKYDHTRWLMGRAKLKTLKETTLNSFLWVAANQGLKSGIHFKINHQSNIISFANRSEILMKDLFYYPSDPNFDELGSLEITGAFVDECNQITEKAWNITMSRIRYNLDENGLIPKIFGTCNPAKNFVYKKFYRPAKENVLRNDMFFVQALATDNPDISKHYINNLYKLDEISKQRLLYGNWEYDDDPAVLIEYEKIVDLFTNEFVLPGKKYITCDVARLGNDKTKIRVWDGLRSIRKITMNKSLVTEVADKIKTLQSEYSVPNSNTIVDEDGVGGGVVDILKCRGFVNGSRPIEDERDKNKKNYANLRSQCYFKLADIVNSNQMYLPDLNVNERDEITEELGQIKQKDIDKDGKLAIIGKDEIKKNIGRSPDEADNLMMRMWFEINPNKKPHGHRVL